jgi:Holliday junction resolvase
MAKTPERKVKDAVVTILKRFGAYYFYPVSGGFGRSGVPDIVGCYMGLFVAIECKAGVGKTTALQDAQIEQIKQAGGVALVIRETNLNELTDVLTKMESK